MNNTKNFFQKYISTLILFLFTFFSLSSFAQDVYISGSYAIGGYDTVGYFTESRPVKGSTDYSYSWSGATWLFSSQENLDKFRSDPTKYAPQYGGFCAYGVSQNYKVRTVPEAWTIINDRLYLNYSLGVRSTWLKDTSGYIELANENWVNLSSN